MLADNLENILKVVGINEFPQETVIENGVVMEFHSDLFSLIQEGIREISFLNNSIRRVNQNSIMCELRECVEGNWYRTVLNVTKEDVCRVKLEVLGKEVYTDDSGFRVRGGVH